MDAIRLVVIDDHTLFRTGLYELLTHRGLDVVGMTGNSEDACELVVSLKPDIALLDLRMGEISGLEVLQSIRNALPDQTVVMLTTSIEEKDVDHYGMSLMQGLSAISAGFFGSDQDRDELEPDSYLIIQSSCLADLQ